MAKAKRKALGDNPISTEKAALKGMITGKKPPAAKPKAKGKAPAIRAASTTVTPGGLLRKSMYFTEAEWQAIRERAYEEDRAYADIVREAVRAFLGIEAE